MKILCQRHWLIFSSMARKASITGGTKKVKLKPQKSREIIRKYHVLLKKQAQLKKEGNVAGADAVTSELEKLGGLQMYQQASISGQMEARGGDSSKLLMNWLAKYSKEPAAALLEVGCLSFDNYCTRSNYFARIDRLDLNSQDPRIEQIDFMKKPVPPDLYDVVSLSLVVNFVPDSGLRGEMLKRTRKFLKPEGLLFFVLPEPCIYNSRYCNEQSISDIFNALGYRQIEYKRTRKLVYWLLKMEERSGPYPKICKTLVNDGAKRNNFCIALS